MTRTMLLLLLCLSMLASIGAADGDGSPRSIREAMEPVIVVEAVVGPLVGEQHGFRTTTQTIRHVYCGTNVRLDQTFLDTSTDGADMNGMAARPTLSEGEGGLWLLQSLPSGLARKPYAQLGFDWPVRSTDQVLFARASELAKSMETVWNAPQDGQLDLVKQYARSAVPEVSAWAIRILAESAPAELKALVSELLRSESFSLFSAVALDEVLCRIDDANWRNSQHRKTLLRDLAQRAAKAENGIQAVQRIDMALQRNEIDPEPAFATLGAIASNQEGAIAVRRQAIGTMTRLVNVDTVHDTVFDFLFRMVKQEQDQALRQTAAHVLSTTKTVQPSQAKQLADLLQSLEASQSSSGGDSSNQQIAKILRDMVRGPAR